MMNDSQFVIFKLDTEYYGIRIDNVETIERNMEITRVPKTQSYIQGVINLRGEIVPIIDLRDRLGLPQKEYDSETRIIVNKIQDLLIGYIVDSTSEVKEIPPSQIDYTNLEESQNQTFVRGLGKIDGRMIILLDIDKILEKE